MRILRLFFYGVSLLSSLLVFAADEFNYQLLRDRRASVKLPEYSLETRQLLIRQARLMLVDLYANRDLKLATFGRQIDPLPLLEKLEKNLDGLSIEGFHQEMVNIFALQRDLHARYYLPLPYGCYRNMMPFTLREIQEGRSKKVVVSSVVDVPEFLSLLPKDLDLEIGDELLSVNHQPLRKLFQKRAPLTGGANEEAAWRIFLEELSFTIQTTHLMPQEDEVILKFRKRKGGVSQIRVPWVNRGRTSCLDANPASPMDGFLKRDRNELFPTSLSSLRDEEEGVSWRILENRYGRFAVLKLEHFDPVDLREDQVITLIEKLMKEQFADTDGLIIDVRNNPGGQIPLGEMMLQLFGPIEKNKLLNFSFNINDTNLFFLRNVMLDEDLYRAFYDARARGDKLSTPIPLTDLGNLGFTKPAYSKPVAIFTNASCYSTCDMFAAQMQDHGYAIVVGEDTTTGAGGANFLEHTFIIDGLLGQGRGAFKPLPAKQDMTTAWRQAYRITGQLIENVGVKSDYVIRPTLNDVRHESRDQFLKISRLLDTQKRKR
jgi:hypothetical protein